MTAGVSGRCVGQHMPTASMVPAQHRPSRVPNRSNPHTRETSQNKPITVGPQSQTPSSHVPLYEHVSRSQKSHLCVLHGTASSGAGAGHFDSSVSTSAPTTPSTHRTDRFMTPPSHSLSHLPSSSHSPTSHLGPSTHACVWHSPYSAGGSPMKS